jgi:hypothetical protein
LPCRKGNQGKLIMKFENVSVSNSQVFPEDPARLAPTPTRHVPGVWHSNGNPAAARQETSLNGSNSSPKIVLYSHDTFGMGNIRRTLLLSHEFISEYPGASILIITGSPMIHAFRIPKGIDYIKLAWTGSQRNIMGHAISQIALEKSRRRVRQSSGNQSFDSTLISWLSTKEHLESIANSCLRSTRCVKMAGTQSWRLACATFWMNRSARAKSWPAMAVLK